MFDLREMAKDKVLVAAHRGTCMGNIPCNTSMAFNFALANGADIIELDITRSADGTLYVFHPGKEPDFLHTNRLITSMHDDEVSALRLCNSEGTETQYSVPKLDDILEELKGRCVINLDKTFDWPEEIIACVRRHDMVDQALIKTEQDPRFYDLIERIAPDFAYMTFAHDVDRDTDQLLHRNLNYLGTEALFTTEESEFATLEYHEKMHKKGLLTWANAIVFNYKTIHSAGHTDDISIMGQPDNGWGYLAGLGYDMIQTDWAFACAKYLEEKGYR